MLCQFQKVNLSKITDNYNFNYLCPSPDVYNIRIPQKEQFSDPDSKEPRRRIYYNVTYDARELQFISEVKAELHRHNIHQHISDELILKHSYMAKFQKEKVIERLRDVINYHKHPVITNFDQSTLDKLRKGINYTYGCDKGMRPIIIIRLDLIDFEEPFERIINAYYYLMLVVYQYRMVPYHAEKVTFIADLGDISLRKVPIFSLYDQMKRLGVYYCGITERTLLYNASGIGWLWRIISSFLTQSQKKKLIVIPKGQEKKALEYIDPYELQSKYGGKLPDLNEYWPPKATSQAHEGLSQKSSSADYLSIENNFSYFELPQTKQNSSSCCGDCKCTIY